MKEAESAQSVGWGGSEAVKEIGARARLVESGKELRDPQLECDLFLLSANALTADGRIVNIDGTGNRVAASICGPKRVVYVIGRNKIVDGGVDEAIACGLAGACVGGEGCDSPDRMCKVTAVFDRKPTGISAKVILVDEDLGY